MTAGPLNFFELMAVLRAHDVEFVLIGGFALAFHGAPRGTKDVDIVPDPDLANISRLWDALRSLNASPLELPDFEPQEMPVALSLEGLQGGGNWALATRLGRLDVMQWVGGVDSYAALRERAIDDSLPNAEHRIWIASRDDLVEMKRFAGRPQDMIDIAALRMAEGKQE